MGFFNKKQELEQTEEIEHQSNGKWIISKSIDGLSYGHRVWVQRLEEDYCAVGDTGCKCKFLHGHNSSIRLFFEADELNAQSMVSDFKHTGVFKDFLDKWIDHKFILDLNDPYFSNIINAYPVYNSDRKLNSLSATQPLTTKKDSFVIPVTPVYVPGTDHFAGYAVNADDLSGPEREFYEGFFLVPFVPTSENLSKWLFDCVDAKMSKINVKTSRVDWWETPKSKSTYIRK